jgi:hypothetical protein
LGRIYRDPGRDIRRLGIWPAIGSVLFLSALPWAVPFLVWQVIAARGVVLAERLAPPERVVEDDQG